MSDEKKREYSQLTKDFVTEYSLNDATLGDLIKELHKRTSAGQVSESDFSEVLFNWFWNVVYEVGFNDAVEHYEGDCDCCGCESAQSTDSVVKNDKKKPELN